jgi:hypothetical protein
MSSIQKHLAHLSEQSPASGWDATRSSEAIGVYYSWLGTPIIVGRCDRLELDRYDLACSYQAVRVHCVCRPPRLQGIKVWLNIVNHVPRQSDCKGAPFLGRGRYQRATRNQN